MIGDGLLFLHVLGAMAWVGGGIFNYLTFSSLAKAEASVASRAVAILGAWGAKYYGAATGVVLLSGIGLVLTSEAYDWGSVFVWFGIAAFVFSIVINGVLGKKTTAAFAADMEVEPERRGPGVARLRRTVMTEFAVLFVVVWAMVAKLGA